MHPSQTKRIEKDLSEILKSLSPLLTASFRRSMDLDERTQISILGIDSCPKVRINAGSTSAQLNSMRVLFSIIKRILIDGKKKFLRNF